MISQAQVYTPTLLWYQNSEYVFLTVQLQNVKNEKIELLTNKINFSSLSNDSLYEMNFELFDSINMNESKYTIDNKSVKIVLKKENSDKWTTVTKDKNLYKNSIKVDWNSWVDDSDEEEADNTSDPMQNQQFDFQKMMASMQGMGNMPDMESMMQGMQGMDGLEGMDDVEGDDVEGDDVEGDDVEGDDVEGDDVEGDDVECNNIE
jgi:hypothetical protein